MDYKKTIFIVFFLAFCSFLVISSEYNQNYNLPPSISTIDSMYCRIGGSCSLNENYAEVYFRNQSGVTIIFSSANKFYNMTFYHATKINGFTNISNTTLRVDVAGRYLVNYVAIGSGINNHEYVTSVGINGNPQQSTTTRKRMTAGDDITPMNGNGIIDLAADDLVTLMIKDYDSTSEGTQYGMTLTLLRIGNGQT